MIRGTNERTIIALLFTGVVAVACQTAQQSDTPGTATGSTTLTRGASTVARSDTTRVSGGSQSTPSGGATLTLDRASYAAGATVTMRITSQTRDTLGFNQCSSRAIERQDGGRWVPHPEPDRMCTMELRLLMPNETQSANTDLPDNLRAGTYRMVLTLSRQSSVNPGTVRAVSANFRVS